MKTIYIPQLGRSVSRLGIGSSRFDTHTMGDAERLLDRFFVAGGNLVDTAEVYAGGRSELAIGHYLRQRGTRPEWIVLTKACERVELVRPDYINSAVRQCLERLQTDVIDLFVLHRDNPNVPVGELVDALVDLRSAGLISAYGFSNWQTKRIEQAQTYARACGRVEPCLSSPHLGLATPNQPMWPHCTHATREDLVWYTLCGLPVFGWSAQCRGFFAEDSSPDNLSDPDQVRVYHSAENFEKLRRARCLASSKGVSPVQIALAWVLNQSAPTVALVGPSSEKRLQIALDAMGVELSAKEVAWLELRTA